MSCRRDRRGRCSWGADLAGVASGVVAEAVAGSAPAILVHRPGTAGAVLEADFEIVPAGRAGDGTDTGKVPFSVVQHDGAVDLQPAVIIDRLREVVGGAIEVDLPPVDIGGVRSPRGACGPGLHRRKDDVGDSGSIRGLVDIRRAREGDGLQPRLPSGIDGESGAYKRHCGKLQLLHDSMRPFT